MSGHLMHLITPVKALLPCSQVQEAFGPSFCLREPECKSMQSVRSHSDSMLELLHLDMIFFSNVKFVGLADI